MGLFYIHVSQSPRTAVTLSNLILYADDLTVNGKAENNTQKESYTNYNKKALNIIKKYHSVEQKIWLSREWLGHEGRGCLRQQNIVADKPF